MFYHAPRPAVETATAAPDAHALQRLIDEATADDIPHLWSAVAAAPIDPATKERLQRQLVKAGGTPDRLKVPPAPRPRSLPPEKIEAARALGGTMYLAQAWRRRTAWAEQRVIAIIGRDIAKYGRCTRYNDDLAHEAKCGRSAVKRAKRLLVDEGLASCELRKRTGFYNDSTIVTPTSKWLGWLNEQSWFRRMRAYFLGLLGSAAQRLDFGMAKRRSVAWGDLADRASVDSPESSESPGSLKGVALTGDNTLAVPPSAAPPLKDSVEAALSRLGETILGLSEGRRAKTVPDPGAA